MAKPKLYQMIIDEITQKIYDCDYDPDKPICTEKQLCEEYSVSRITAKKAIEALCQKGILYRKRGVGSFVCTDNRPVQSLEKRSEIVIGNDMSSSTNEVVALILPFDISNSGIWEMIQALSNMLSFNNIHLAISISDRSAEKEKAIIRQLWGQAVSAIVFYPASGNVHMEEFIPFIIKSIPIIIIDKSHDCKFMYNVISDNQYGQQQLTQHLIDMGHRKIAYLAASPLDNTPSVRDRFFGYTSTLVKNGIQLNNDYIDMNMTLERIESVIKKLIDFKVTAIEAEHDELAYNIFLRCKSFRLNIPGDIAIVGFDDDPRWATTFDVSLTTIKQNYRQIGERVSEIISANIQKKPMEQYNHIIPVEMIVRRSTCIECDNDLKR